MSNNKRVYSITMPIKYGVKFKNIAFHLNCKMSILLSTFLDCFDQNLQFNSDKIISLLKNYNLFFSKESFKTSDFAFDVDNNLPCKAFSYTLYEKDIKLLKALSVNTNLPIFKIFYIFINSFDDSFAYRKDYIENMFKPFNKYYVLDRATNVRIPADNINKAFMILKTLFLSDVATNNFKSNRYEVYQNSYPIRLSVISKQEISNAIAYAKTLYKGM